MTSVTSSNSALPSSLPLHKVAVAGASGRMGHMLIEAIASADDCSLTGALDMPSSPAIGTDAGAAMGKANGVLVTSDLKAGLQQSQFLIEFTAPRAFNISFTHRPRTLSESPRHLPDPAIQAS